MLLAITPRVRFLPPARFRAWRLGWYLSSSMAFSTRARVEFFTTLALFNTRETVAVETFARRATCSRFMENWLFYRKGDADDSDSMSALTHTLSYLPIHRIAFIENAVQRLERYILGLIGGAEGQRLITGLDPG